MSHRVKALKDIYIHIVVVVVVAAAAVVVTSPSGSAYMGRQMSRGDEDFHQIHVVLKYIFDVNAVTEMTLTFRCPPWA